MIEHVEVFEEEDVWLERSDLGGHDLAKPTTPAEPNSMFRRPRFLQLLKVGKDFRRLMTQRFQVFCEVVRPAQVLRNEAFVELRVRKFFTVQTRKRRLGRVVNGCQFLK